MPGQLPGFFIQMPRILARNPGGAAQPPLTFSGRFRDEAFDFRGKSW
jgi:hypothetical protein